MSDTFYPYRIQGRGVFQWESFKELFSFESSCSGSGCYEKIVSANRLNDDIEKLKKDFQRGTECCLFCPGYKVNRETGRKDCWGTDSKGGRGFHIPDEFKHLVRYNFDNNRMPDDYIE